MRRPAIAAALLAACSGGERAAPAPAPRTDAATAPAQPPPIDAAPARDRDERRAFDNTDPRIPDSFWAGGCPTVLGKIAACLHDKTFVKNLLDAHDDNAAERREQQRRLDHFAIWFGPDYRATCAKFAGLKLADAGFTGVEWDNIMQPDVGGTCALLGDHLGDWGGMPALTPAR